MFALALSVVIFTTLLYAYVIITKNQRILKNLPGPKPNLFLGNTIDFLFKPTYEYLTVLIQYLDTHGSIIKVHDGPLHFGVIVRDVKFIEHILSSTKLIDKGSPYAYLHDWLGTGLLTSTGAKWKKRRRMLTPAFHFSILENFVEIFETVGDVFIKKLENEVGKSDVDICPLVSLCTLDAICEAAMGIKLNAQANKSSEYVRSVKTLCRIITDRMFSALHPVLYPLTLNHFKERRALKILHGHTDSIIDQRIREQKNRINKTNEQNGEMKRKPAFLDLLLNATIDGKYLSRMDIREEVDTFMFEGHDTTSAAISFALYCIATHPDVQEKVLLEQKDIFEDFKNAKPNMAQLQEMKYLDLVIKETLRLYPSVPYYGRAFSEDVEWEGIVYPKGCDIMVFAFAIQRDPKYFPDPLKFKPERFEELNKHSPYVYIPFSAGPRNCIGQKFAMLEMKSTISKVVRNFELHPPTPQYAMQLSPETILVSKNGVRLSLKKRTSK
nr:cytochrome P450 CYP4NQ23 [Monolepta hieroglyphica]